MISMHLMGIDFHCDTAKEAVTLRRYLTNYAIKDTFRPLRPWQRSSWPVPDPQQYACFIGKRQ